jgi:hypothetical protein
MQAICNLIQGRSICGKAKHSSVETVGLQEVYKKATTSHFEGKSSRTTDNSSPSKPTRRLLFILILDFFRSLYPQKLRHNAVHYLLGASLYRRLGGARALVRCWPIWPRGPDRRYFLRRLRMPRRLRRWADLVRSDYSHTTLRQLHSNDRLRQQGFRYAEELPT